MKQGKGIVVEVAGSDHVIVMTSRGEFLRVPFSKPVCVDKKSSILSKDLLILNGLLPQFCCWH